MSDALRYLVPNCAKRYIYYILHLLPNYLLIIVSATQSKLVLVPVELHGSQKHAPIKKAFSVLFPLSIKCQCCPHIETSQLIYIANELADFYMRATLAFIGLMFYVKTK